jgi:hypothetical protein
MGLLEKVGLASTQARKIVTCHECTKRFQITDENELNFCPKCNSPYAEYPNIMADENFFTFTKGVNKWVQLGLPSAGIDSSIRRQTESSAIGVITGRITPTHTFSSGRKIMQIDGVIARSEHMNNLKGFWWLVALFSIPVVFLIPPLFCVPIVAFFLAIESGTQKKMSDSLALAASRHPHMLSEEGNVYCYLRKEQMILACSWKGHTINISTAVNHRTDGYLKINWTSNSYGSHDDGYSVDAVEAILKYPGRMRGIVMENYEYPNKETAEKELKDTIRREDWFPVLGVDFEH